MNRLRIDTEHVTYHGGSINRVSVWDDYDSEAINEIDGGFPSDPMELFRFVLDNMACDVIDMVVNARANDTPVIINGDMVPWEQLEPIWQKWGEGEA